MVGVGEKVKEAVTGHHNNTANKNDSLACEDRGAQHHTGHAHHDPEAETKKATSAAGNYPYWGNLERDGQGHRSEGLGSGSRDTQHSHGKTAGGIGAGALATGAGASGAGHLASREGRQQEPLYASTRDAQTTRDHPGGSTTSGQTYPTTDNTNHLRGHEGALAGAGAGAGVAGAGYLASRDRDDRRDERNQATSSVPGTHTSGTTATSSSRHHDPEKDARHATSAAGNYPNTSDHDSRREKEYLGAGAGAAGLAGAGYLASKDRNDEHHSSNAPGSNQRNVAFSGNTAPGTQTGPGLHSSGQHHHDPEIDAQKATSAAGNYPHWGEKGGEHNSNREGGNLGVGAAGLAGAAGAGYVGHNKLNERKDAHQSYPSRDTTTGGSAVPSSFDQLETTSRGADPYGAGSSSTGHHHDSHRRGEEGLAGAAGLGAAGYAANEGHRHNHGDDTTRGESGLYSEGYNSNELTPAQLAAQRAWEKENPGISGAFPDSGENNLRSDNTLGSGNNNLSSGNNLRSDAEYAAAGTAAGAGAAGLASKQHGHGKDYEDTTTTTTSTTTTTPRTRDHRGSDTADHDPNSQIGVGRSSGAESRRDEAGKSGEQPKVVHKCVKCGHGNDISHYAPLFRKDATARVVK
ncbi:hypothetical protein VMCG_06575 [Cytospora schulzeri]|uniref:Uncharacterized protein n=1 Tax=Cytospora schulzeri TaxID=448051 RepID=A0A423W704_9PEZI|nr:hypothetical protein VMCG_06575 [Valsa malicola]